MERDSSSDTPAPAPGKVLKLNPLIMATEDSHTVQRAIECVRVYSVYTGLYPSSNTSEALKYSVRDRLSHLVTGRRQRGCWRHPERHPSDVTRHGDLETQEDRDTGEG